MGGNRTLLRHMPLVLTLAVAIPSAGAVPGPGSGDGLVLRPAPREGHGGGPPELSLDGAGEAAITLWRPDLKTVSPSVREGRVAVESPFGNYHAVVAEKERDGTVRTAIRYVHRHGRPSGHSPRELLGAVKAPLEIVPDPVPREHHQYMGGHEAVFLVRYRGSPLPRSPVTLHTANGTVRQQKTGPRGRVRFRLPDDFSDVRPGRHANRPGELRVAASHSAGGTDYATTLSARYHVDPGNWRSLGWAVALMGAGFLAGLAGTRRDGRNRGTKEDSQ